MESIGIDVHKNQSQVCILTDNAELIEKRIRTDRLRFAAVLGIRPPARILIEASTERSHTKTQRYVGCVLLPAWGR